ncbi:hypothetical protein ZIOFF_038724 [Zingiber officinale]|uniref:Uncharacterized protein n=1 Tax=Zingiber officinale TaxID=94328 RepID=A0A8J5L350_ZINOF|nr:hypothetical protein ZIOFF_038724 [Zingiber officinale]
MNIPHRPSRQRPTTALPPDLNNFHHGNPWFMGGSPVANTSLVTTHSLLPSVACSHCLAFKFMGSPLPLLFLIGALVIASLVWFQPVCYLEDCHCSFGSLAPPGSYQLGIRARSLLHRLIVFRSNFNKCMVLTRLQEKKIHSDMMIGDSHPDAKCALEFEAKHETRMDKLEKT